MLSVRQLLSTLALTLVLAGGALAQGGAPAVTASASAERVRIAASGEAVRVRLQVYTEGGQVLFEGARDGGVLDWPLVDNNGTRLPAGSYGFVVTVETVGGARQRRSGVAVLDGGSVSLRAGEAAGARKDAEPISILNEEKSKAAPAVTHDGDAAVVASGQGALSLRTGDVRTGQDREQVRVTAEGRVGIGTGAPEAALDVNGEIRARGGIRFDDGTVLTSAKNFGRADAKGAGASTTVALTAGPTTTLAGTGTTNRLAKWLDNTGTVGDSAMSEVNGNLVINGGNFQFTAPATTQKSTNLLFLDSNDKTMGMVASATPSLTATNGPIFYMRGNTYSTVAANRGMMVFGAGNVASPTGREGSLVFNTLNDQLRMIIKPNGNVGIGSENPTARLEVAGAVKIIGAGSGIVFPDGTVQTTAGGAATMTGTQIVSAINGASTAGVIGEGRLSPNVAKLNAQNAWTGQNTFVNGLSANGVAITNVGNPVSATDAVNKAYTDANFVQFVPGAEQLSVGDANGTAPMINLRGGSTCCSGPGGHTPAWFKVFQNGSFVATGNLGIGVSPMQGKGYRTSWDSYKGAFRSGYADNEWDDATVGFFSWAGGSNSTAEGLYALAFGDTNFARSTSSIVFGSGNEVKGAAGFAAGAGNRVCDTYGVAFGNKALSGGPILDDGKCDPDTFNIRGLAAVAIGYNVTASQDHTMAFGKFASNNGFSGTFIWSDGSATASADTFRNTANNEFAARATGGFRFRTNLAGTTGCNLPAGSGVFNCTSSRTTKENFSTVDGNDVLARLRKVPVSTWNYIAEGQQSRHLGPMAEDFYSAFQLGTTDKAIGIQDAVGVSLAAVKALDAKTLELQQKTEEVEQLHSRVQTLEARLAAIEQALNEKK